MDIIGLELYSDHWLPYGLECDPTQLIIWFQIAQIGDGFKTNASL